MAGDPIRLTFLGEEREFASCEPGYPCIASWVCDIPALGPVVLNQGTNYRYAAWGHGHYTPGDTPQSAATALENALRPLAKAFRPLLDVCWHCGDVLLPTPRARCERCPADGDHCAKEKPDAP